jgi:hypothetical protein
MTHQRERASARYAVPKSVALAIGVLFLWGCAPRATVPAGEPVADPAAVAEPLVRTTTTAPPRQAAFQWTLDEGGSRVQGRGVVRYQTPERIRLDLFGPRNETYLSAALVGEQFRLPPNATAGVPLPSPALLWGGLGAIRPPTGARLEGATAGEGATVLRYAAPGDEVYRYRVSGGGEGARLLELERIGRSGVLESVTLDWSAAGELRRARYRNPGEFRELTLDVQSIKDVESFPESTWHP